MTNKPKRTAKNPVANRKNGLASFRRKKYWADYRYFGLICRGIFRRGIRVRALVPVLVLVLPAQITRKLTARIMMEIIRRQRLARQLWIWNYRKNLPEKARILLHWYLKSSAHLFNWLIQMSIKSIACFLIGISTSSNAVLRASIILLCLSTSP